MYVYYLYMSKPATLSDEAYAALTAQKQNRQESLSQVILRLVPRPIRTFGDLEKHLENLDGPVAVDYEALERIRKGRRRGAN
jgi:predicted CopG family antitoxin